MRIILIGSVNSSLVTLSKLLQYEMNVVAVMGLESGNTARVSGLVSLREKAEDHQVPFFGFSKINDQAEQIIALEPDLIFVVGLSQLVSSKIINSATHGCVGFHPTKLPAGRGRAPLGWLTYDQGEGAATFFKIADGVDDGPIYVQQSFVVQKEDDAKRVSGRIQLAVEQALDIWLPRLKLGHLESVEQDHRRASYHGIRKPDDGWLDWQSDAKTLHRLILSAARPHPGAYTFCGPEKIIIWGAREDYQRAYRGVVGRIQHVTAEKHFIVQTGEGGLLRVSEYEALGHPDWSPKVGDLLGYYEQAEIFELKGQVTQLLERVAALEHKLQSSDT
ncbi:MAG: formyltransferase family protein [Granulosicoccus sp.]